ncbi:DUF4132 domain-containing protein [Microbulbifer sp. OS29]|uniref:DUF4132 domain-containing protein n=1 Tax=Microbulbifer okhotskensis TaxID=2926617 RepID=A0A9X2J8T9_9GAMM|nr:DUF4132 domain-containing protein [Microbulbifer okhotskensis]MCO1335911.1 DUF4132 domain-containing protein [Microbulbifer okhotskensis]
METQIITSKKSQQVLDVFKEILPEGEKLQRVYYSIKVTPPGKGLWEKHKDQIETLLGEKFPNILIDLYANPEEHQIKRNYNNQDPFLIKEIAIYLTGVYLKENPSEYIATKILERLEKLLKNTPSTKEKILAKHQDIRPTPEDFVKILTNNLHYESIAQGLKNIFSGEYNKILDIENHHHPDDIASNNILLHGCNEDFSRLLVNLYHSEKFDYDWFKSCSLIFPSFVKKYWDPINKNSYRCTQDVEKYNLTEDLLDTYSKHYQRLLVQLRPNLKNSSSITEAYSTFSRFHKEGSSEILQGLKLLESLDRTAKNLKVESEGIDTCIVNMLHIYDYAEGEGETLLASQLKEFKEKTLLLAYPYAGKARRPILKALQWEDILTLHDNLFHLSGASPDTSEDPGDIHTSESTTEGVIDRKKYLKRLGSPDPSRLIKFTSAIRGSNMRGETILLIINALLGLDREKIEKTLKKHGQVAIKAYGLLPLEGKNELKQRYLKFKEMTKEAAKYGQERCANTRAAVICGMKNLAQTAGFSDEVRMGWAMEAGIASDMLPFNEKYAVLDWEVSLHLEGIAVKINVHRGQKLLKSVPPKIRKSDIYQQMRECQEQVKRQASTFKKTLESMMCDAELIESDELNTLAKLPVARQLLSQLILMDKHGRFGIFSNTTKAIIGLKGEITPIQGPLTIAHVYSLFDSGVLSDWQRHIVDKKIVQPFKQVFRELYIVSPAEIEAGKNSRRFFGHTVIGSIMSKLLQSRSWNQHGGDEVTIYKQFTQKNILGYLDIPEARYYLSHNDKLPLQEIWFSKDGNKVPLNSVDPIVFSEFMRDIDLIVSVARAEGSESYWSKETTERRTELIASLVQTAGLNQVRCEGHYAYIQGSLAKYRIHLGSGVIHIQPGNYLCIVPGKAKQEDLYLPFSDADIRMAEIVSKIFLLIADDKIEDEQILRQIQASMKERTVNVE